MNVSRQSNSPLSSARLLVADDDPGFRMTVIEILTPYFETIDVESGEQAIEVVRETRIDLVLLDMHMHVLTGLDTIRQVREEWEALPWILMSSDVSAELKTQALELDAFTVLRKPPHKRELLDTIHCALEL